MQRSIRDHVIYTLMRSAALAANSPVPIVTAGAAAFTMQIH